jgi:hypothetical protein
VKCSSATCKMSVTAFFFPPDDLSMTVYRCLLHERPGSSGQTSLVAATSQSVRFTRSLATRFQVGQTHVHNMCLSAQVSAVRGGGGPPCTLVVGTQDVALDIPFLVKKKVTSSFVSMKLFVFGPWKIASTSGQTQRKIHVNFLLKYSVLWQFD